MLELMRLWPLKILSKLPDHQLLGQHRECCALRGMGWGRKHSTVDYVFKHPYYWLYAYHCFIMQEMMQRKFNVDSLWLSPKYRGCVMKDDYSKFTKIDVDFIENQIYPEHDQKYLDECLENLKGKGIEI